MGRVAFISHSSEDRKIGEEVCRFLEKHGLQCWIAPRDVTPGKNYGAAILDAIDECRVFILILSGASNKSGQVVREVERAASTGSIIIPFRIENVEPSRDLQFYVSAAHWLDASTKPLEKHLRALLKAVQDWEQRKAPAAPVTTPPPLPETVSVAPTPTSQTSWRIYAIVGGVVFLVLCAFGAFKISRNASSARSTSSLAAPALAPAPSVEMKLETATASPAATVAMISPSPLPSLAAIETPIAKTTPRRRPGEPLRATVSPSPEASIAPPPSVRLRPGQAFVTSAASPVAAPNLTPNNSTVPLIGEVVASSELDADSKNHRPSFAFDNDPKTVWATKGDGAKQSISVHFKTPATISSVSILNSGTMDESVYRTISHVHTVRMKLSDGTVQVFTFDNKPGWHRFELSEPKTADWAQFEIVTVFSAKKFKSVPIAEIAFNRDAIEPAPESAEPPKAELHLRRSPSPKSRP